MYKTTGCVRRYAYLYWREYVTSSGRRLPTDGVHTVSYDLIVWC